MLVQNLYLSIFIGLLTIPLSTFPQEKKVVSFKDLGFQFSIPDEWNGKETEAAYLLTSPNNQGFVMISTLPFTDITELQKQLNGGIKREKGFFLAPTDRINLVNPERLQGKFSGLINFSPVIAYIIVLKGGQQQMFMILSADSKENYSEKSELLAAEIAESFRFFKPQMPSLIDEYKALLSDSRLTYIESDDPSDTRVSVGYQAKITIDLCSQGYFNFYNFRSDNGASAFSANNNNGAGKWQIIKNDKGMIILQLRFYDEEIYEYQMEYFNGKIFLDGDHYLRTTDGNAKYKPDCN